MMIIPTHLQIETINGYCTARCTMCTIDQWKRQRNIMNEDSFRLILEKFIPYKDNLNFLTIHGCGEPLLDKNLPQKIKVAKEMGYRGIGFATNCTELDKDMSRNLINAGLDTIICSIDGFSKEIHESIRVGTNYDLIVKNVLDFIDIRNQLGSTRVMVRFIRQNENKDQWKEFLDFWLQQLNKNYGDEVVKFDIHNWGEDLTNYNSLDLNKDLRLNNHICQDLSERLFIYSNGEVGFCCADDDGYFNLGNVIEEDPIKIYNNGIFQTYREKMLQGKIAELDHCKTCTIPRSRILKECLNP